MKRALTAEQMRAVDGASPRHGVSTTELMEHAGEALAVRALVLGGAEARFFVVAGPGNNGGDGFVVARRLAARGRRVFLELLGEAERLKGDAALNWGRLAGSGASVGPIVKGDVRAGDVIVDAIFGTGLTRAPEGRFAEVIERIAAWRQGGATVLAADLPSGLDGDTGQPFSPCVQADATVSLGFAKLGQAIEPGLSLCGELEIADIGIPPAAESALSGPAAWLIDAEAVTARLPRRGANTHKGSFGHVLVVAGSHGKSGAAALSGLGALRGGAGLVTVCSRADALAEAQAHAPELMGTVLEQRSAPSAYGQKGARRAPRAEGPRRRAQREQGRPQPSARSDSTLSLADLPALLEAAEGKQAIVIGPGIPRGDETPAVLGRLLAQVKAPMVLDADALNAVADDRRALSGHASAVVLTPHPGEMARLMGTTTAEIQRRRPALARELAASSGAVVVLKGARTLVAAPDGTLFINPTGNPGMATAGTGDVLSGVIAALLAQGLTALDAAIVGVWAHGRAGDLMLPERGQLGLIASDLLVGLGRVWAELGR